MRDIVLIGSDDVARAASRMMEAAQTMHLVANQIEHAFQQRRLWEEEYLARIEAIVREELDFYAVKKEQAAAKPRS